MSFERYTGLLHSQNPMPPHAIRSPQLLLIRLLTGATSIDVFGTIEKQSTNFAAFPASAQSLDETSAVRDFLHTYDLRVDEDELIKATIIDRKNRGFYQELLAEFINYFLQRKSGSDASAFIFLYRILERISFSTPLLYCSLSEGFYETFDSIKSLFVDENGKGDKDAGELGLLKKFISQGRFIDRQVLEMQVTISFASAKGGAESYFETAKKICANKFISAEPSTRKITIKFKDTIDWIITMRNRFFHSKTGDWRANIRSVDLIDCDEFFECMNNVFCSYLSLLVLQTIASRYQATSRRARTQAANFGPPSVYKDEVTVISRMRTWTDTAGLIGRRSWQL